MFYIYIKNFRYNYYVTRKKKKKPLIARWENYSSFRSRLLCDVLIFFVVDSHRVHANVKIVQKRPVRGSLECPLVCMHVNIARCSLQCRTFNSRFILCLSIKIIRDISEYNNIGCSRNWDICSDASGRCIWSTKRDIKKICSTKFIFHSL